LSAHPSANELAALFDDLGRSWPPFLHALRCPRCAEVARAVFAFNTREQELERKVREGADYGPAFRKAAAAARVAREARQAEVELVSELLGEILSHRPAERPSLVRRSPRFRSLPLAVRLLDESRARMDEREDLAGLTVLLLDWWDEPRQEVLDLRAEARAELADVLRQDGRREDAERQLVLAAADLQDSTDPLSHAALCLALAQLRHEEARFDEAWALIDRAAELLEDGDDSPAQAAAYLQAAEWAIAQGEPERATSRFDAALALPGLPFDRRRAAYSGLLLSLVMDGREAEARRVLSCCLERLRPSRDDRR
jgi:tetratricopeptide (TPR) repeat protein